MTLQCESLYRSRARKRRQHLIAYLRDTDDTVVQFDDLVEYIHETEPDSLPPDRESVRLDLYHVHLPLLDEADVVEFDHRSETVQYRSHPGIEVELEQFDDTESGTETDSPPFP